MSKVILINGKKRSGKDYSADLIKKRLEKKGYTAEIIRFADPMKFIVAETFGISEEDLDTYKNDVVEFGYEIKAYPDNQPSVTILQDSFRGALQRFGTEAMKPVFGDNIWAKLLYKKAKKLDVDFVLVPDFRFLVEYKKKAITLKIRHDVLESECTDTHASETELNDFNFDYEIDNTGYPDTTDQIKKFVKIITK